MFKIKHEISEYCNRPALKHYSPLTKLFSKDGSHLKESDLKVSALAILIVLINH